LLKKYNQLIGLNNVVYFGKIVHTNM